MHLSERGSCKVQVEHAVQVPLGFCALWALLNSAMLLSAGETGNQGAAHASHRVQQILCMEALYWESSSESCCEFHCLDRELPTAQFCAEVAHEAEVLYHPPVALAVAMVYLLTLAPLKQSMSCLYPDQSKCKMRRKQSTSLRSSVVGIFMPVLKSICECSH